MPDRASWASFASLRRSNRTLRIVVQAARIPPIVLATPGGRGLPRVQTVTPRQPAEVAIPPTHRSARDAERIGYPSLVVAGDDHSDQSGILRAVSPDPIRQLYLVVFHTTALPQKNLRVKMIFPIVTVSASRYDTCRQSGLALELTQDADTERQGDGR